MDKKELEILLQRLFDADQYDALKGIADSTPQDVSEALSFSIDRMLIENNISSLLDPEGYETSEQKDSVLKKLQIVQDTLNKSFVSSDTEDYIIIEVCIKYVKEDGYALTEEILETLNVIYKRYA